MLGPAAPPRLHRRRRRLRIVGFVTVHDDEVEQLFVAASARGTGVARSPPGRGGAAGRASPHRLALVAAGNARARLLDQRSGPARGGGLRLSGRDAHGVRPVPSLRYEKTLNRRGTASGPQAPRGSGLSSDRDGTIPARRAAPGARWDLRGRPGGWALTPLPRSSRESSWQQSSGRVRNGQYLLGRGHRATAYRRACSLLFRRPPAPRFRDRRRALPRRPGALRAPSRRPGPARVSSSG